MKNIVFCCFFDLWAALLINPDFSCKNGCDFRIRRKILHGGRYLQYLWEFFKGSYKNNYYVKNGDFCGTEISRNSCSKDLRWKCRYCTKNENNNAMYQYFNVSAKKNPSQTNFYYISGTEISDELIFKISVPEPSKSVPKMVQDDFFRKIMKTF